MAAWAIARVVTARQKYRLHKGAQARIHGVVGTERVPTAIVIVMPLAAEIMLGEGDGKGKQESELLKSEAVASVAQIGGCHSRVATGESSLLARPRKTDGGETGRSRQVRFRSFPADPIRWAAIEH